MNSIRWGEVNDCTSFKDGDKRKVKLYGKVYDKEFKTEMEAERWLWNYFKKKNKNNLLYKKKK